ncbi:hypothetical protein [Curtobacterium sp. L1-20]|uniref:hypothetical protein n=1 Tax=Curtobacterium sp. L1-20 TaxID=3138181 RepID=UPI003B516352
MDARDDQPTADEAPPGWVLGTPTRPSEVWLVPSLLLALAVLVVAFGSGYGDPLAAVVGWIAGPLVAVGAVALLVSGRRAYDEQTLGASWRAHVVRVVVGVGTVAVLAVASLVVGVLLGTVLGLLIGVPQAFRYTRAVPRLDRLVVGWACAAVAVTALVVVVLQFVVPDLPRVRAVTWGPPSALYGVIAGILAVVHFRLARSSHG